MIGHSISAQFNSLVLSDVLASKHTLTVSFACISALKHYTINMHADHQESKRIINLNLYLKQSASTKVMAGRTLTVADANVAVVYFIPRKYKFWSRTGL